MKLLAAPTSPYVRKVRVLVIEKQLQDQVEIVNVAASDLPAELVNANPLARIPTLVRDDGSSLVDSPVICEYLDSLGKDAGERSGTGDDVWAVKHLHAFADGVIDTVFSIAMERRRDESEQSPAYIKKQIERIARGVAALNAQVGSFAETPNLGEIAVACCLGYMDLRLANDIDWRKENAALAEWFAEVSKRPSLTQTKPPQ